jgi:glycosyltransferase involved in cell wall biosynthesis
MTALPVSVIITTKNEAQRINKCIDALKAFDEIIIVDSDSTDGTQDMVARSGVVVIPYKWNGTYPKKRQWCLDHLALRHDWIFFVDADEIVTEKMVEELQLLFAEGQPSCEGYFVPGRYVLNGRTQRFGLCNNKLALFDRRRFEFPVVNDLGLPGMGEMEGHYQPVPRAGQDVKIGKLKAWLLHDAYGSREEWLARHRRYAAWEAGMNAREAWPNDPVKRRQVLKRLFREMPGRPLIAFSYSYLFKMGFMDGVAGLRLATDRYKYYRMVQNSQGSGE